jgi:hypothetical protein
MSDPDKNVMVTDAFITGVTPSSLNRSRFKTGGWVAEVVCGVAALVIILPINGSIERLFITFLRFIIKF